MNNLIACEPLSPELKAAYGEIIHLPEDKARTLHARGKVRMLPNPIAAPESVNVSDPGYLKRSSFTKDNFTKVAWVQDFSKMGGAEISNCTVVKAGEKCGFDIVGITPSNFYKEVLKAADVIIINNFMEFQADQFKTVMRYLYEEKKPYVKYDHDYRELKRGELARQLFTFSKLNVFISPNHKKKYVNLFGQILNERSIVLPLAIDTDLYKTDFSIKKDSNSILVPCARKCSNSLERFIKDHPDFNFTIIDSCGKSFSGNNIKLLSKVSSEEMVKLYQAHDKMYHCPDIPCPGERLFFEAQLCGCTPIVNENVGHASWKFDIINELKPTLERAPYEFWRMIDERVIEK